MFCIIKNKSYLCAVEREVCSDITTLKIRHKMKYRAKKTMSLLMMACIVAMSCAAFSACRSEQTMYGRKQTNKGATVKSNIKVKGSNKANGHTTRSY